MRTLLLLAALSVVPLVTPVALAQSKCGSDLCMGSSATQVHLKGNLLVDKPLLPGAASTTILIDGGVGIASTLDVTGTTKVKGVTAVTGAAQDGGSAQPLIQWGWVTLSSGTATVTFTKAFAAVPTCVCNDVSTTAAAADCSGATTTVVVPKGGSSAVINWICVGDK